LLWNPPAGHTGKYSNSSRGFPGEQKCKAVLAASPCRMELSSCQRENQPTLLDWLPVEYGVARSSHKLLAPIELDSGRCIKP
jgi:hypothetical protein